jgi:hypothetical protein
MDLTQALEALMAVNDDRELLDWCIAYLSEPANLPNLEP